MSDKYLRSEGQNLINSLGTELCWGWSPAVNFVDILPVRSLSLLMGNGPREATNSSDTPDGSSPAAETKVEEKASTQQLTDDLDDLLSMIDSKKKQVDVRCKQAKSPSSNDVHILLCGSCDIRHIFKTLSAIRVLLETADSKLDAGAPSVNRAKVHFYLYEPNLRVHARHLFFLQWLCDSMFSLNQLEDQVAMFLDVYGNVMLRESTVPHVKDVSMRALRTLGYGEGPLAAMIDTSDMKAKERDFVEDQVRHWTKDTSVAHSEKNWNNRLRTEMAERYDNKENIFDWDFNFHLYEYTNTLKFPEYRTWRNTGIAFDYCHINPRKGFQYEYNAPNKTLCHFDRKGNGVFLGDIKNGPFYSVGIDTKNKHLRPRNADGTLKYGNGVTAMHNVRAWLYELMTGKEWPWSDHAFAWDDVANYNYLPPGTPSEVEYHAVLPRTMFHMIGLDFQRFLLHHREESKPKFDAAFVGSNSTQFMTPEFFGAMADDGVVVCETVKFVVDCQDEAKAKFVEKIHEFGAKAGWEEHRTSTASLHRDLPEPRTVETTLSEAQKKSNERLMSKHAVVLKKKEAK